MVRRMNPNGPDTAIHEAYEAKRGRRGRYKFYSRPDFLQDFRMPLS